MIRSLTLAAVAAFTLATTAQAGGWGDVLHHVNKGINTHQKIRTNTDFVNHVIRPVGRCITPAPPIVHPPVCPPIVRPPVRPPVCLPIVRPPVRPPVCPPIVRPPVCPPVCPPIVRPPVCPPVCPPIVRPPVCPPVQPPVCPPVVCPTPEPAPITYPISYPVAPEVDYGSCRHVEELAGQLEEQAKAFCLDLAYNYSHNHGFQQTYAQAYWIFEMARYIHGLEQYGDRDELRSQLQGLDTRFHAVQVQVRGWSRQPTQQVGEFGIFTKMEQIEDSLHHLTEAVGVPAAPAYGQPSMPVAYDNMPPSPSTF